MHSDFGYLFCVGPQNRSLTALTREILADPESFLLSPQNDMALL